VVVVQHRIALLSSCAREPAAEAVTMPIAEPEAVEQRAA
jgi:hypothetical protein